MTQAGVILLAGPPGAGKSTVAAEVALQAGLQMLDLDRKIEAHSGSSPAAIIRNDGEGRLRRLEAEVLEALDDPSGVLALGGGTLTSRRSRRAARARGPVIGLAARLETLLERVQRGDADRPLLAGDDPKARLAALLEARQQSYAAVDATVDAEQEPRAVARAVLDRAQHLAVIHARIGARTTRVLVGKDLATAAAGALAALESKRTPVLLVDLGIPEALRAPYVERLRAQGPLEVIELEGGEPVKQWAVLGRVLEQAISRGAGRQSVVIGLGGGAVCDLAALTAALLGRGAPLILIPTTLLSQADAAVGGKCAVNIAGGRNLAGTFHPAEEVIADVAFLDTLDPAEYRSGLAEVLKMGVIADPALFEAVAANGRVTEAQVARSIQLKAEIVASDPEEHGQRKVLNLGHTLGHALEAASEFTLRHGEAVAMGMAAIARLSAERGHASVETAERVLRGLEQVGLPTRADPQLLQRSEGHLLADKKADDSSVVLIWIREVGKVALGKVSWREVTADLLRSGGGK